MRWTNLPEQGFFLMIKAIADDLPTLFMGHVSSKYR
jgi:hypothetical protein